MPRNPLCCPTANCGCADPECGCPSCRVACVAEPLDRSQSCPHADDPRHGAVCSECLPVTTKDTNPKDAIGSSKVPASTVPRRVVGEVGLAMLEGAAKYGRSNYRVAGVRASVYFDAANRHLDAWWEGQDLDPDSGLSHVTKAIAGLMVLRDSMLQGNWQDDRPPRASNADDWVSELNAKAKEILARYPNPKPPFTQR